MSGQRIADDVPCSEPASTFDERHRRCERGRAQVYSHADDCEHKNESLDGSQFWPAVHPSHMPTIVDLLEDEVAMLRTALKECLAAAENARPGEPNTAYHAVGYVIGTAKQALASLSSSGEKP